MKKCFLILVALANFLVAKGQSPFNHGRVIVSPNGHYLQYEDGLPFFWLGDTAWELFHRLTISEINTYLDNRKAKGFNVIQAVALAEFDGLTQRNQYGDVPLLNLNPQTPNEKYFALVDTVVKMAQSKGLYIGLLPTWGDKVTPKWSAGPAIFNVENAYKYGLWIASRYKSYSNILWILGGDRPAIRDSTDWRPVWRAMANGILDATQQKAFITYHPSGGSYSTSQFIHNEPWLSMNMIQSGHGGGHDVATWDLIGRDFNLMPHKPVLDAEPNYEDHPVNPWPKWDPATGYYRDYDVRKQLYRSVFAGACGVTYGHHSVWQFYAPGREKINYAEMYWTAAIDRPGAYQAGYLGKLMSSRPILNRVPDGGIIANGQGLKGEHSCAFADSGGTYLMVYMPIGKHITINTGRLHAAKIVIWWYNPKNGQSTKVGVTGRKSLMDFTPPTTGAENDWVLVLDDPKYKYAQPGS
jgi:hypothetical protein